MLSCVHPILCSILLSFEVLENRHSDLVHMGSCLLWGQTRRIWTLLLSSYYGCILSRSSTLRDWLRHKTPEKHGRWRSRSWRKRHRKNNLEAAKKMARGKKKKKYPFGYCDLLFTEYSRGCWGSSCAGSAREAPCCRACRDKQVKCNRA